MQQMQYLLSGMFGRACKLIGDGAGTAELAREVGDVRQALVDKLAGESLGCPVVGAPGKGAVGSRGCGWRATPGRHRPRLTVSPDC